MLQPSSTMIYSKGTESVSIIDLAKMIDHSLLHPTLADAAIEDGLQLSKKFGVATPCVKLYSVSRASRLLEGSCVGVCAVVGFPHGNSSPAIKVTEAVQVVADGATEVDVVVNIGKVLSGEWGFVRNEIEAVSRAVVAGGSILKVIFENDILQENHIIELSELCTRLKVEFVKTSTGYGFVKQDGGNYNYDSATDEHIKLMRKHSGRNVKIKAEGGIRTLDDLLRVRSLGVARIGATGTEDILREARE